MILSKIVLFLILLVLSALFSGAEAAYFTLKNTSLSDRKTLILLENPRRLLITLLTGNTIVNTAMAILAALITADIAVELNLNVALSYGCGNSSYHSHHCVTQ